MNACTRILKVAFVLLLIYTGNVSAQAWVELVGPASQTYQAPASFGLGVRWGVVGTGPKAEYLDNLRLLRNGTVVTIQAGGTFTEAGLSPGTYLYELRADAVRNLPDGDQTRRSIVSAVGPITVNAPPAPFDGAEFVSTQMPGPLQHRTAYTWSATVRNAGNTIWPAGYEYQLAMAHDGTANNWSFSNVPVPHEVGPGQTVTFTFNIVTPPPGEYGAQFQMFKNGVGRFGAASGLAVLWVNGPINKAQFIDQVVPDHMEAGKVYNVSLRMRNSGNTTWTSAAGYALGIADDNSAWNTGRLSLSEAVGPGAATIIGGQVRAPTTPGAYNFRWQMVQDGVEWFGVYTTNVVVTVTAPPSLVTGSVDGLAADGSALLGWACSTNRDDPIDVHLYSGGVYGQGGVFLGAVRADIESEAAVAASCGASGSRYRFRLPLSYTIRRAHAGQLLYVHGISPVGGENKAIPGSGSFRVPPVPVGNIAATPNPCTISWGQSTCAATVQWSVSAGEAQLWAAAGDGPDAQLASGSGGSLALTNITDAGLRLWLISGGEVIATTVVSTLPGERPGLVMSRTEFAYDELGRVISRTEGDGTVSRIRYDQNGNVLEKINGKGDREVLTYDALGRRTTARSGTEAPTTFRRDASDRVVAIIDPNGLVTSYERDGFGRVWRQQSPDTGVTTFAYAAPERMISSSRADGVTVQATYDSLGRVRSLSADQDDRVIDYDVCLNGKGKLCAVTSAASQLKLEYAQDGQVAAREEQYASPSMSMSRIEIHHDVAGRPSEVVYPDGSVASYGYVAGALTTLSVRGAGWSKSVVTGAEYAVNQRPARVFLGNGTVYQDEFDSSGRVGRRTVLAQGAGAALEDLAYAYDGSGAISSIEDALNGALSQTITYDASGRLSSLQRGGVSHVMSYDANGNWLSHSDQAATRTYQFEPTSNRLQGYQSDRPGDASRTYHYDGVGNRTGEVAEGDERAFQYDGFNRLIRAQVNGSSTQYLVNGLGQRVGKLRPDGSSVNYVYVGQNQIIADHDSQSGWTNYLWFGETLMGVLRSGQLHQVRGDHLGRPSLVTNEAAQVVWKAYNYAYGRAVIVDQIGGLNLGFPGQYHDAETGLWYNGYRDYDPVIGRYLQSDPVGLSGGINTYVYAGNNPISMIDPLGLTQCDIDAAFEVAKELNPDLKFGRGDPKPDMPRAGDMGRSDLNGDRFIHLNERYLDDLDWAGQFDLFDTIIHEGLHFTRPAALQVPPRWDHVYINAESRRRSVSQAQKFDQRRKEKCECTAP